METVILTMYILTTVIVTAFITTTPIFTTSNFNVGFRRKHFNVVGYRFLVGDYGYVSSWLSPNRRQGDRRRLRPCGDPSRRGRRTYPYEGIFVAGPPL